MTIIWQEDAINLQRSSSSSSVIIHNGVDVKCSNANNARNQPVIQVLPVSLWKKQKTKKNMSHFFPLGSGDESKYWRENTVGRVCVCVGEP